jgi:hypothetical protein
VLVLAPLERLGRCSASKEPGYDPSVILAARIAEVAIVVFLATFLVGRLTRR